MWPSHTLPTYSTTEDVIRLVRYRPPRCNKDVLRNLIFSFIKDQNYEETYRRLERCEAMHQLLAFYKHRVNRDDLRDHVSRVSL